MMVREEGVRVCEEGKRGKRGIEKNMMEGRRGKIDEEGGREEKEEEKR